MKKVLNLINGIILIILVIFVIQSIIRNKKTIPADLSYQNQIYHLTSKEISNIEREIGTIDKYDLKVYKIQNIDTDNSIAILIRTNPPKYLMALKGE